MEDTSEPFEAESGIELNAVSKLEEGGADMQEDKTQKALQEELHDRQVLYSYVFVTM